MLYQLHGRLQAYLCDDCLQNLGGVTIRLYRLRPQQDAQALAAARPKTTFSLLDSDDVRAKAGSLLAETTADADGSFTLTLDEKEHDYDGGAFEVDVRLTEVPGADRQRDREAVQFTVTTLRPDWTEGERGLSYTWRHRLTARYWCYLIAQFDVWVLCGRVVSREGGTPVGNLTVRAFDRDWLQDDPLGEDVTDSDGRYRIYYTSADFKETPFSPALNVELVSGPDLYFEVLTQAGEMLLDEAPSEGRQPPRENVGHCYCETLVVDTEPVPPYLEPYFTHVGNFDILYDIDPSGLANKAKTGAGGAGYGFFGNVKLKGYCPKTDDGTGQPLYYRFLYVDPATSAEEVVTGSLITPVVVGSKLVWWDVDGDGTFGWTLQDIVVAGSGATPPLSPGGSGPISSHVIVPDATTGWIAVDPDALDSGFYGPLVRLRTDQVVPGGAAPGSGAGTAPADPKDGRLLTLIFETTTNPSDPAATVRQSDTVTLLVNNWTEVRELDLQEFQAGGSGGCTELTTQVTILYTADHQRLASWSLGMSSAASAAGWTAPSLPAGTGPRGAAGTEVVTQDGAATPVAFADWPACSYVVRLTTRRMLTDGENDDDANTIQRTFCKS